MLPTQMILVYENIFEGSSKIRILVRARLFSFELDRMRKKSHGFENLSPVEYVPEARSFPITIRITLYTMIYLIVLFVNVYSYNQSTCYFLLR